MSLSRPKQADNPLLTGDAADHALDRLIDVVCPYTDGYVPDAIKLLEAIFTLRAEVGTLSRFDPAIYFRSKAKLFE